ncbi:MAG: CPBP family glutamic-type intramembrane protease [Polyangiaceae bacterium]|nr:CPBP family glutamic-type intramembrane protease [Polyangiaceae bacterium]
MEDLALTFPILVGYHLAVYFMPVRNAADLVTRELVALSKDSSVGYLGLTLGIATLFVGVLLILGRGQALRADRFFFVALEGVIYAAAMRFIASYVVGKMFLAGGGEMSPAMDRFTGLVMSTGAGFYEELTFRVLLYGLGARLVMLLFPTDVASRFLVRVGWAILAAAAFSAWHYIGELGDEFEMRSFIFRWVCGLVFTLIYQFRGFAPVVWTHALYDIWVLVL